jgi:hypothetical protein
MKTIVSLSLALVLSGTAFAQAEIKQVCRNVTNKTGQVVRDKYGVAVQDCKKIKVHKKLSGTPVPIKQ